jgi:hypothetical protein
MRARRVVALFGLVFNILKNIYKNGSQVVLDNIVKDHLDTVRKQVVRFRLGCRRERARERSVSWATALASLDRGKSVSILLMFF